jgi:hypothetical protein
MTLEELGKHGLNMWGRNRLDCRYREVKNRKTIFWVGFEVLTVVIMKSALPWDVTPCSLESPMFRRKILPPSSGSKSKPSMKSAEAAEHWWWGKYIPPKYRVFSELHGVTTHKAALFIFWVTTGHRFTGYISVSEESAVFIIREKYLKMEVVGSSETLVNTKLHDILTEKTKILSVKLWKFQS